MFKSVIILNGKSIKKRSQSLTKLGVIEVKLELTKDCLHLLRYIHIY